MNVFIYWVGPNHFISEKERMYKDMGLNVEIGPSKEDHIYLYEKYKYYRDSYDLKIYSFCSDVWRYWKMQGRKGLYIDAGFTPLPQLKNLLMEWDKADSPIFPRVAYNKVMTGIFWNNGSSLPVFDYILNFISKYNFDSPREFELVPHIFDFYMNQNNIFNKNKSNEISIDGMIFTTPQSGCSPYSLQGSMQSWKEKKSSNPNDWIWNLWYKKEWEYRARRRKFGRKIKKST